MKDGYWNMDCTGLKVGKPKGWDLKYLTNTLSKLFSEQLIANLTILVWNTQRRGTKIPHDVIFSVDILLVDDVLVKDRTGKLESLQVEASEEAMQELAKISQEFGLYDSTWKPSN